jgi:exopolyphosphatase/guanosine-5'-triphosphate,3'-diphosphate pyrophosphatase
MFAAVDLGSNSFRLHVGQYDGEAIRVVKSARDPIRLAAGLDKDGRLTPEAMQVALDCLARFRAILATYELDAVRVVATNTMRIAKIAAAFLPAAERAIGYPIEIISGEEEGRLIYMGVACSLGTLEDRRLVIDIGGGSTEMILGCGHAIERVESFGVGTFNQCQTFFTDGHIDAERFDAAIMAARSRFEDAAPPYRPQYWEHAYGSSGTMRAISDAISKNDLGDGTLSYPSMEALKHRLISFGHTSRIVLAGMKPDRATVMVGGLSVLMGLMQELGIKQLIPIEAGLRMGVLWDLQLRATKRDRREQSVHEFLRRFHADPQRAASTAEMALALFGQMKPAADTLSKYLYWSALLHEIGVAVSQSSYHKHGAYLMQNADLPGFTTREQRSMGTLILAQKGNLRKVQDQLADSDFAKAVLALRLAVMFMHTRIEQGAEGVKVRMRSKIELEIKGNWMDSHPTLAFWLDKEKEAWAGTGMEFVLRKSS